MYNLWNMLPIFDVTRPLNPDILRTAMTGRFIKISARPSAVLGNS
jgi:hypothetical protein